VLPIDGPGALEQTWAEFRRQPKSNPSELLLADFGVVSYMLGTRRCAAVVRYRRSGDDPQRQRARRSGQDPLRNRTVPAHELPRLDHRLLAKR
jgi:hypothetical protein